MLKKNQPFKRLMRERGSEIVYVSAIVLTIALAAWFYNTGNDSDDYERICLGGKYYWHLNYASKTNLALDVDADTGLPIKCEVK